MTKKELKKELETVNNRIDEMVNVLQVQDCWVNEEYLKDIAKMHKKKLEIEKLIKG